MVNTDELLRVVGVCVTAFLAGYVLARLDAIYVLLRSTHEIGVTGRALSVRDDADENRPARFRKSKSTDDSSRPSSAAIEIDERKFVTKIDTGAMALGSNAGVGTTITAADKINESVSKLSQLKGK